jgi:UDP-glucose 4-epimerase
MVILYFCAYILHRKISSLVLVTGRVSFIGSHTILKILKDGYEVYIIHNLDKYVEEEVNKVRDLVNQHFRQNLHFFWEIFAKKRI